MTFLNSRCRKPGTQRRTAAALPAFTLLEIVIVLTLLAILVAATVPSFRGLKDEQVAREPIGALAKLVKEARLHAMKEKRPYQIAFTSKGFRATRYLSPYMQAARLEEFLQQAEIDSAAQAEAAAEGRASEAASPSGGPGAQSTGNAPAFREWTERYDLPEGVTYSIQYWHDAEATPISGETVKYWVFQPSGVCKPLTVRIEREAAVFEANFSALTGDIVKERSEYR